MAWDLLIKGAKVFDGTGVSPRIEDIAIADGRIAARGDGLARDGAARVIEGDGLWAMPGLLDVHTHFDLEVEIAPGLPEAVRHGTTTVVVANCSLGLAYGAQRRNGEDPVVDCFARVENVPKHVLKKVADRATWSTSADYLAHLDELPLGPNIVPMIPHSMLRIEVMGLKGSISREPRPDELEQMTNLLETAMDEGYPGFSTDALPFHYLANQPNTRKKIPTQYGSHTELKRLTGILRERGRTWQATPPKDSKIGIVRTLMLTSGRLHGRPLKTTVVAALDVATNRGIAKLGKLLSRILNSKLIDGHFRLQALAAPFRIWSEGPLNPLFEEIPELRELNEPDLEDRATRQRILNDPGYQRRFRRMWWHGRRGFSLARIKRWLDREDIAFDRDLDQMTVDRCPVEDWNGRTLGWILRRTRLYAQGEPIESPTDGERVAMDALANVTGDEADFFLGLLRHFDTDLIWTTVSANRDPEVVRDLIMDPLLLPGFNDSGAHLTNMAFYDCNLRALQIAATIDDDAIAFTVKRLTREPAELFGVNAGTMEIGDVADLTIVDPKALARYRAEDHVHRIYREEFEHEQLVNRTDGLVPLVIIGGEIAWEADAFAASLGEKRLGRTLLAAA
ncbi:MAG: N-acyl-D-glutamate deacylase [Pseudomonadota bacterium]